MKLGIYVMVNAYQVLGIKNFASQEEIRNAYRRMSKKYHPDLHRGAAFYEDKFKEIQAAYETLSNIEQRMELDSYLRKQHHEKSISRQQKRDDKHAPREKTVSKKTDPNKTASQTTTTEQEPVSVNAKKSKTGLKAVVFMLLAFILTGSAIYYFSGRVYSSDFISKADGGMDKLFNMEVGKDAENERFPQTSYDKYFSIHATKDEVRQIHGEPTNVVQVNALNQEIWYYEMSSITFENGRVSEYANIGENLQITYFDTIKKGSKRSFSMGSTRTDVLRAQGNPTGTMRIKPLNQEIWYYGESRIMFEKGKVREYSNNGQNLLITYSGNFEAATTRQ